ncbi:HAD-IA family hydrolase [Thermithiobacillus plumbiphilus]|uniref:HAD-IA family hydrolase n=1 Tax=Thermithiobacillus plumbiphilus TaxID=1729899 RepID=A0ABU9D4E8_9PROT
MQRRYELIVFDWDGTLMDSVGLITSCLETAFQRAGLPVLPPERYRAIIGLGLQEAMSELMPDLSAEALETVVDHYRDCFLSAPPECMPFFAEVESTLEALHGAGYRLAVATGKARRGLARLFEQHGICRVFSSSRCADESQSKPAPDMLLELMQENGVSAEETLMVGDSLHDIRMARAAGVDALGVAHGVNPCEELLASGAIACLASMADLLPWLEGRAGR